LKRLAHSLKTWNLRGGGEGDEFHLLIIYLYVSNNTNVETNHQLVDEWEKKLEFFVNLDSNLAQFIIIGCAKQFIILHGPI